MAGNQVGAFKGTAKRLGITLEEYLAHTQSGEKWCYKCVSWKPIGDFVLDRSRRDGHKAKCGTCDRVKVRVNRKGEPSPFKGKTHTPEAKQRMSELRRGKPIPNAQGKIRTPEQRAWTSFRTRLTTKRGPDHYNWKGGVTPEVGRLRRSAEYRDWRTAVFTRDNFTCQKCGDARGGNLRAHHIKPFAANPEERFNLANGVTLCCDCHDKVHFKPGSIRNRRKLRRGERLWK